MLLNLPMRRIALLLIGMTVACGSSGPSDPTVGPTRSYRMGFSSFPPRPDQALAVQSIELWSTRADAAILHEAMPWTRLLAGADPDALAQELHGSLVAYYRGKGHLVVFTLDPTDGLSRGDEAPELRDAGRSITESAVQQLYRRWGRAVLSVLKPDYLGLAAETNLIRFMAPRPVYDALVRMTNDLAAELAPIRGSTSVFVSVQVETAWGKLATSGGYQGVTVDLADFPFMNSLGLSSYPYFGWPDPNDVPLDYFSRLPAGRALPVLFVEGGWTSAGVGTVTATPETQARWIRRFGAILDSAKAVAAVQLAFTDIDVASFGLPPGSIVPLFAHLGMVDINLSPKPALAVWDSLFALRRPQP